MKMKMKMKMDCLPPRLFSLRFLFLVLTISMSFLAPSIPACSEPFKCGDKFFGYPFGTNNSGCGDPALQLDCGSKENMAIINIGGYQYYILNISEEWWDDPTIKIISKDQWKSPTTGGSQGCNPSLFNNYTSGIWSNPQFSIAKKNKYVTLWEGCSSPEAMKYTLPCNTSWYFNLKDESMMCESQVTFPVPVEISPNSIRDLHIFSGFWIKWSPTEACGHCASKEGLCAYKNDSMKFDCYCGNNSKCHSGTKPSSPSIILGSAIGSGALLVMGALLLFVNRKRCLLTFSVKPDISNVEKFLQDYVHQMPCRYSYSHLIKMTNKFAHKVGEGGFGVVYKGKLPTGETVAVKMLDQSRRCEDQFMNEIATIGRIHHVHLVRLMGYCYEEHRNALVYEYMANGSLDNFIFAGREKEQILSWAQLFSIALGAARGIAYLHQDCDNRIVHFDIKPHNILLDEEFTAKVADFGLAKLCGKKKDDISMTAARGTPGYAAPEVWKRNLGGITDKSDVYSFGMVLLEMVGGRKNIDVQVSRSSQMYFPEWAFRLMENGQLERALRGVESHEDEEKVRRLAKVGMWCIQYFSRDRPSMSRVVQMLEGNGDDVSNPPQPFNSSVMAGASKHSSEGSSL